VAADKASIEAQLARLTATFFGPPKKPSPASSHFRGGDPFSLLDRDVAAAKQGQPMLMSADPAVRRAAREALEAQAAAAAKLAQEKAAERAAEVDYLAWQENQDDLEAFEAETDRMIADDRDEDLSLEELLDEIAEEDHLPGEQPAELWT
jgi:hypothetical protein